MVVNVLAICLSQEREHRYAYMLIGKRVVSNSIDNSSGRIHSASAKHRTAANVLVCIQKG